MKSSQKTGFEISCKFACNLKTCFLVKTCFLGRFHANCLQTICMKSQNLFSGEKIRKMFQNIICWNFYPAGKVLWICWLFGALSSALFDSLVTKADWKCDVFLNSILLAVIGLASFRLSWQHFTVIYLLHHNLFITLLLGSIAQIVLVKQPCYIQTKMYRMCTNTCQHFKFCPGFLSKTWQ